MFAAEELSVAGTEGRQCLERCRGEEHAARRARTKATSALRFLILVPAVVSFTP